MEKPIFEFLLNESKDHFTTSLVSNPAVESKLIYFDTENEKPTLFANEEKRMIFSIAMVPNKMIFRKEKENVPAHYGFFSAETIEKFQENYAKHSGDNKVNINHNGQPIEGVTKVESWIVLNNENDKSKELGIEAVNGSLIQGFKIDNDEVWEQCKNGEIDGLSIEAYLDGVLTTNNIIKMNKEKNPDTLWELMKSFFATDTVATETTAPAAEAETPADAKMEDDAMVKMQDEVDSLKASVSDLQKQITDMQAADVESDTKLVTMTAELEKFKAETPVANFVKDLPKEVVKSYAEMSNFEKMKFNKENK